MDQRAARLASEEKELGKVRSDIDGLRKEIASRVIEISADEQKNIRTLSQTYTNLTPRAAVAIFKEMDDVTVVKILSLMKADVVAPIYMSKFLYAEWRPATAINQADTDNNPFTDADPTWKPRAGGIGGNPAHTSGHSAFSAAAAAVTDLLLNEIDRVQ